MKNKRFMNVMLALAAVMIFCVMSAAVFAEETVTEAAEEVTEVVAEEAPATPAAVEAAVPEAGKGAGKDGKGRGQKHHSDDDDEPGEWLEDWFEDRIDARKAEVDFTQLPENPTDEEMIEFFKKNFMTDSAEAGTQKAKASKEQKKAADCLEDWFEDRIEAREDTVDFSKLPENPTQEQILEFFETNFLNTQA